MNFGPEAARPPGADSSTRFIRHESMGGFKP
jgi:hypothetical protein